MNTTDCSFVLFFGSLTPLRALPDTARSLHRPFRLRAADTFMSTLRLFSEAGRASRFVRVIAEDAEIPRRRKEERVGPKVGPSGRHTLPPARFPPCSELTRVNTG